MGKEFEFRPPGVESLATQVETTAGKLEYSLQGRRIVRQGNYATNSFIGSSI